MQSDLQINARLLQTHVQKTTGRMLTLKDIHNVKARTSSVDAEWQQTVMHINGLKNSDPGASIEIVVRDNNVLDMLIIQTSQMKATLANFPEVVQMDGTYRLNKSGMPLYALVVEDAHGVGQLVALVLIRGECGINIQTMLEHLKASNPALQKTAVFIVDKDFAEIYAIRAVFPEVCL